MFEYFASQRKIPGSEDPGYSNASVPNSTSRSEIVVARLLRGGDFLVE